MQMQVAEELAASVNAWFYPGVAFAMVLTTVSVLNGHTVAAQSPTPLYPTMHFLCSGAGFCLSMKRVLWRDGYSV